MPVTVHGGRALLRAACSSSAVLLAVLVLLASAPLCSPVRAQGTAASPVNEFLDRITADINDLRYAEALRRGRTLAPSADAMPLAQRVRWRLLMAAAFYPEPRAVQGADSALAHLVAALRLAPDARYAPEMRWRGLDSLLARARARSPFVVLRAAPSLRIGARVAAGNLQAVATRPVHLTLSTVDRATGRSTVQDTAFAESVSLSLAAHDDGRLLIAPGVYDLVLTAVDPKGGEPVTVRYEMTAEGKLPALAPEPQLPASALLPEHVMPARRSVIAKTAVFTGLTLVVATAARGDAALRDNFSTDARSYLVAGAMVAGAGALLTRVKGKPIPQNVAANAIARARHERAVNAAVEANRKSLASYAVTVRIAAEPH